MKILIIGGTGIIGGSIATAAAKKDNEVFVISRNRLPLELTKIGIKEVIGDWSNIEFVKSIISNGFDVIVDTLVFNKKQLIRSMNIIEGKCKHYIFISTDSVYPHPSENLEEDNLININDIHWEYGINKREAELYLLKNEKNYTFSWSVIRPTITFGNTRIPVGFASKRNTYTLIERIIQGKPIIRFDDPKTKHSVCHTSIFGEAAVGLFLNEKAYSQFYHISDDYAYSYDEIFNAIEKNLGMKGIYVTVPIKEIKKYNKETFKEMIYDKNPDFTLNNTKIKSVSANISYHIDIEEVMKNTIEHLKINGIYKDEEYNYITDNILMSQVEFIEDKEIRNKVKKYVSSFSNEYIKQLRMFKNKVKIREFYYFLKKNLKLIYGLFRKI